MFIINNVKYLFWMLFICILFVSCKKHDYLSNDYEIEQIKRIGMVIKIRPNMIEEYKKLHANDNAGVRDLLTKYGMRNFSIFLQELEPNKFYEFGYYEYVGKNFELDMAAMALEERTIEWLKICDPMQIPLEGNSGWKVMEQVYYNK